MDVLGKIEQIETSKDYDILDICNGKPNLWIFSLFTGYRQLGQFKVNKPHEFHEGQEVIVTIKDKKIVNVIRSSGNNALRQYTKNQGK